MNKASHFHLMKTCGNIKCKQGTITLDIISDLEVDFDKILWAFVRKKNWIKISPHLYSPSAYSKNLNFFKSGVLFWSHKNLCLWSIFLAMWRGSKDDGAWNGLGEGYMCLDEYEILLARSRDVEKKDKRKGSCGWYKCKDLCIMGEQTRFLYREAHKSWLMPLQLYREGLPFKRMSVVRIKRVLVVAIHGEIIPD